MSDEKKHNLADKKAERKDWLTPPKILEPVRRYFGGQIPLDPATGADNPTDAQFFFTKADDGLVRQRRIARPQDRVRLDLHVQLVPKRPIGDA